MLEVVDLQTSYAQRAGKLSARLLIIQQILTSLPMAQRFALGDETWCPWLKRYGLLPTSYHTVERIQRMVSPAGDDERLPN